MCIGELAEKARYRVVVTGRSRLVFGGSMRGVGDVDRADNDVGQKHRSERQERRAIRHARSMKGAAFDTIRLGPWRVHRHLGDRITV